VPDIAMCANIHCPLSRTCYRFMAVPTPGRQSYLDYHPEVKTLGTKCDGFKEIRRHDVIRKDEGSHV
jgi:hypothetical protein